MLKVLSNILCDLDPKVKVIGQKAGICDGVPSTSALVLFAFHPCKFCKNAPINFVIIILAKKNLEVHCFKRRRQK